MGLPWDLCNQPAITSIAEAYLGKGFGCSNFIYEFTKGPELAEIFPLHFDDFKGKRCLKAYIYLTDCRKENGAFRYIPGTHHLCRAFVSMVNECKNNSYQSLLNCKIPAFSSHISSSHRALTAMQVLQKIREFPDSSYDYCVEGPVGTLVIFDSIGIHGGGSVFSGDRNICRYHYVDSSYVSENLPDQLPPVAALIARAKISLGARMKFN